MRAHLDIAQCEHSTLSCSSNFAFCSGAHRNVISQDNQIHCSTLIGVSIPIYLFILSNIQNVLYDMCTFFPYGYAYPRRIEAIKAFVRYDLDPCPFEQESQYLHAHFE